MTEHFGKIHAQILRNFHFLSFSNLWDKMSPSTKLDDKLEGIENFHAWKLFTYTWYSQKVEHLEQPLHTNRSQINTPMFVTWPKPLRGK